MLLPSLVPQSYSDIVNVRIADSRRGRAHDERLHYYVNESPELHHTTADWKEIS